MNLKKYVISSIALGLFACPLAGQASMAAADAAQSMAVSQPTAAYSLDFDAANYASETLTLNGQTVKYRAYRNVVYVAHPKSVQYESMNLFIPEGYFSGETINGYTAKTAPIFLPNTVGGYMPGNAGEPLEKDNMSGEANAALVALSKGYVVACPAIRGRTTVGDDGRTYVGKAPALIVDYKAAVRYLRHNRDRLPAGDTEKIISNGTSAGGALSALLGATGNAPDYEPYLKEIGAADERDDIFASSDYCPITNLDHADMAYEWMFHDVTTYYQATWQIEDLKNRGMLKPGADDKGAPPAGRPPKKPDGAKQGAVDANHPTSTGVAVEMTAEEIAVSTPLRDAFPAYVNSLGLKAPDGTLLTLDQDGSGTFRDYIKGKYQESAQRALDEGTNLSGVDWVTVKDGKVTDIDLKKYPVAATRMKAAPAFDKLDLSSAENDEFGTEGNTPRHFSAISAQYGTKAGDMADENLIRLMNPLNFIATADVAPHFRIRHGSVDRDTALAIPAILALTLQNHGTDVDFFSPWGKGHAGDYDLDKLFAWTDSICKAK